VTQQRGEREVRAALAKAWRDSQPRVLERLATLERTSENLRSGVLDEKEREDALIAAHKLSGALGMFGFNDASACTAEIEALLAQMPLPERTTFAQLVERLRGLLEKAKTSHTAHLENRGS
jgi:HPt (histidine-containing phosphotransfer) domain-containing protein